MENLINNLNIYLSDLNVFYRKLQNYHWNIKGKSFFVVHAKLEEYYNEINEQIDEVAEHILAIGGIPSYFKRLFKYNKNNRSKKWKSNMRSCI